MPTLGWLNREAAFGSAQGVPTRVLRPHLSTTTTTWCIRSRRTSPAAVRPGTAQRASAPALSRQLLEGHSHHSAPRRAGAVPRRCHPACPAPRRAGVFRAGWSASVRGRRPGGAAPGSHLQWRAGWPWRPAPAATHPARARCQGRRRRATNASAARPAVISASGPGSGTGAVSITLSMMAPWKASAGATVAKPRCTPISSAAGV